MADPQHPAVPFEQAVDLLTGEPRQLRPQHPDIAALVERLDWHASNAPYNPVFKDAAAALRTLARPVEDEEVRATAAFLAESGNERVRESASLLARLAREKASAEQERDHLHRAHVLAAEDAARRLEQATRAEQEAARLRGELEKIADFAPGNGEVCEIIAKIAERALAAAAGAEEPR